MKVLVTGATGYVGGRLIPRLLEAGHEVSVFVRDPARLRGRPWSSRVRVLVGDLLEPDTIGPALRGQDAVYYLIHSMQAGADFEQRDREAARNYVQAVGAPPEAPKRTIYLGGLVPQAEQEISRHLQSRAEVGQILREGVPTTEFRAGPIVGSGSASFEVLRYLTERLPVMITPKWVLNEVQPIAIRDVLSYLLAALEVPPAGTVEIGADRLTFKSMLEVFARERGLRRVIWATPILAPRLAARWVGFITPVPNAMAVPIIEGIVSSVLADTGRAARLFPAIRPLPFAEAVRLAIERAQASGTETRWSDALRSRSPATELEDKEGMIREIRSLHVNAPPAAVFREFASLGGDRGWLRWNWAWRARGAIDRALNGPGLRRGRRHPHEAYPGDSIDFWRVERIEPEHLLRLRAEMKVPGRAWLEWEARPDGEGTQLLQTAYFAPKGLAGFLYWYALYPIHGLIFGSLARAIAKEAEAPRIDSRQKVTEQERRRPDPHPTCLN